jgi:hypothetical protein
MVKRRNSSYASHRRDAPRNVPYDFTPQLAKPAGRLVEKPAPRQPRNEFLGSSVH